MMTINPVVDTRYGIWHVIFRCGIRYQDLLREEEIKLLGVPTTGHAHLDRDMMHEFQDTWLTINEMIEYFRKGVEIRVRQYEDTKRIYDYIQAHLRAWQRDILQAHTTRHAPLDDLIDLDRFAAVVYSKAKYFFVQKPVTDEFLAGLERSLNFTTLFNLDLGTPQDPGPQGEAYPKRESFEKLFASHYR